jgi:putative tricarboxylic transport membrane protein
LHLVLDKRAASVETASINVARPVGCSEKKAALGGLWFMERHHFRAPSFTTLTLFGAMAALGGLCAGPTVSNAAWEPTRPVEFVVPAGTGGGADQMARTIQGIISKHSLMKQPMFVVNKGGGAGGEGFLDLKGSRGNPHKLVITLSNLFTTPLGTGIPFSWKDLTPVAMMALDEFILWVNASSPYQSAKDYVDAIKAAPPGQFKMGGTGSKQEDQIVTAAIEKAAGVKMTYIPYRGGGEVAVQLVGNHINSSVNNPIEAVAQWRGSELRPLCVFDSKPLDYREKVAGDKLERRGDLQVARSRYRVSHAARHLHGAGRDRGPDELLRRVDEEGA